MAPRPQFKEDTLPDKVIAELLTQPEIKARRKDYIEARVQYRYIQAEVLNEPKLLKARQFDNRGGYANKPDPAPGVPDSEQMKLNGKFNDAEKHMQIAENNLRDAVKSALKQHPRVKPLIKAAIERDTPHLDKALGMREDRLPIVDGPLGDAPKPRKGLSFEEQRTAILTENVLEPFLMGSGAPLADDPVVPGALHTELKKIDGLVQSTIDYDEWRRDNGPGKKQPAPPKAAPQEKLGLPKIERAQR